MREPRQPVEREVGEQRDNEIKHEVNKARGIRKMAKKDDRPIDAGLAALVGKSEQELIDFWKQRFGLIAAIPIDTARVGALTPQLRELVRIENREERKRLPAARMRRGRPRPPPPYGPNRRSVSNWRWRRCGVVGSGISRRACAPNSA